MRTQLLRTLLTRRKFRHKFSRASKKCHLVAIAVFAVLKCGQLVDKVSSWACGRASCDDVGRFAFRTSIAVILEQRDEQIEIAKQSLSRSLSTLLGTAEDRYAYRLHIVSLFEKHALHVTEALENSHMCIPVIVHSQRLLSRVDQNDFIVKLFEQGADYVVYSKSGNSFSESWASSGMIAFREQNPTNFGIVVSNDNSDAFMLHSAHAEATTGLQMYPEDENGSLIHWLQILYGDGLVGTLHNWIRGDTGTLPLDVRTRNPQNRPATIDRWLRLARECDDWTVVVTVSEGFIDMFENWWYWFKKLQLNCQVLIIAEDDVTQELLNSVAHATKWLVLRWQVGPETPASEMQYDSDSYKLLMARRATYIKRLLIKYTKILFTDVDTIWFSNPVKYLHGQDDIVGAVDAVRGNLPYYCPGFMGYRNSSATYKFVDEWERRLLAKPQHNQPVFNDVVLESSSLRHRMLPRALFPSGDLYFRHHHQHKTVVVHNNYIVGADKKFARLKSYSLLGDSCMSVLRKKSEHANCSPVR